MPNKLQELTDKLYNEGLSRGKAEGEQILGEARKKAEELIEKARSEAESIIADARKNAEDLKSKSESDVRMAAEQSIQATKKDIEELIVAKMVSPAREALSDVDFLKGIISSVAEKFSAQEACDLKVILPEKLKDEMEPWIGSELAKILGGGLEAGFSKKIQGGFTIGPKDGSYFVSLTEESFRQLIAEYMRPVTRKILFGE